jgi:hypothetical protein
MFGPVSPAVRTLETALRSSIPFLAGTYKEVNGASLQRIQIDGNLRHQMGVCLDIILFATPWAADKSVDWESERKLGGNIVKAFVDLKREMGWSEIIYENRLFWEPGYYRHYGADRKHYTHIHIDWMTNNLKGRGKTYAEITRDSPQARNTDFAAALVARLQIINQQWQSGALPAVALAALPKSHSHDMNPVGEWRVRVAQWVWMYSFRGDGTVVWRDPFNGQTGQGTWMVEDSDMSLQWAKSSTQESWATPLDAGIGTATIQGKRYSLKAERVDG